MSTIDLTAVEAAIRVHAADAYPYECCGALYGRDGAVREVLPLPNVTDEGPRRRFRVSEADYRAAEARAREVGLDLVGFYTRTPTIPPCRRSTTSTTPGPTGRT